MILAGLLEAPKGSECATSSIRRIDGPPRLVLLFERRLWLPLGWLKLVSFDPVSTFVRLVSCFKEPSPSEVPASGAPWVELELSLRNRPMIDLGCFGFSIPPFVSGCDLVSRVMEVEGEEKKINENRTVQLDCL